MSGVLPVRALPPGPLVVWTDLHLRRDAEPEIAAFAEQVDGVPHATTLLILGDLFDAWTGPETARPEAFAPLRTVFARRAAAGAATWLLRGNRDVLMTPGQARSLGVELADRVTAEVDGTLVLFSHGDEACLNDRPYQRLRRALRHPLVRGTLRLIPAPGRRRLGRWMRGRSTAAIARKPLDAMALDLAAADRALAAAGAEIGVIGHLHEEAEHALPSGRRLLVRPAWEPGQPAWTGPAAR